MSEGVLILPHLFGGRKHYFWVFLNVVACVLIYRVVNYQQVITTSSESVISRLGKYRTAAVSSDAVPCSNIGR